MFYRKEIYSFIGGIFIGDIVGKSREKVKQSISQLKKYAPDVISKCWKCKWWIWSFKKRSEDLLSSGIDLLPR